MHIENIFGCMLWCLFPSCCVFGRLVMRKVLGNHAPLLLIKAFKHSCVCFVSSLYVVSSCDERVFWACPFTSPPHKGVQAFVFAFLSPSLYVRPSCNKGVFERAHAPLLPIKVYGHSFLWSRSLPCTFGCLVMRERFGHAHAPLFVIKTYEHSCVPYAFFVCSVVL